VEHLKGVIMRGKDRVQRRFMHAQGKVHHQVSRAIRSMQRTPEGGAAIKAARELRTKAKATRVQYRSWKLTREVDMGKRENEMKEKQLRSEYKTAYHNSDDVDKYDDAVKKVRDDSVASIVGIRRAGEDMAAQQEGKRQGEAEHVGNAYLDPDVDPSFRLPEDEDEEAQEAVQAGDAQPGDAQPGDAQPGDAQPGDAHIENKAEVDSDAGHAFRGTGNSAKAQAEEPPADTSSWEQAEQPPAEEQAEAAPAEDGDGEEQAEQHDVAQLADDGQIVAHPDDAAAARDGGSGSNDESTLRSQYEMMMAALDEPVAEPVAKPDKLHSVGEVYVPPRKYTPPAWQRKPHTVHGVPSPQTDKVVPASVEDPPPVAHRPTPTRSAQYINADIKEVIKTGYHNGGMGEKGAQIFHLHDRDLNQTKKDMDAHLDAINAARDARRAKKKHAAVVEWHKAQKQVTKRALPMVQNLAKRYKSKHWKQVWGAFEHRRELGASPAREREHLVHPGEERTGNNGAQGIPRAIQPKVVTDPDAETVEDAVKKSVIKKAEVKTAAEPKSKAVPAAEVQVAASASKQVKMIPAVQLDQELRKEKVLRERMELYKQNDEELVQILKMHSIDVPPGLMP